jgi:hypothetical protein
MKWLLGLLSLIIIGGASTASWFYIEHKKEQTARLAWQQKIDNCIVETLRKQHASLKSSERKPNPGETSMPIPEGAVLGDIFDQVAEDEEVEQARKVCISDDVYDQQHKHDRELYEKAFPQAKKN